MSKQVIKKRLKQILVTALFVLGMVSISSALTVNLKTGVVNKRMPDGKLVSMWGFGPVGGNITVPGPAITLPPGDNTLTINLTNNLSVPVSIVIPGQTFSAPGGGGMDPVFVNEAGTVVSTGARLAGDLTSRMRSMTHETAPGGGISAYTWTGLQPGTYLYQSGTVPAVQVQMGLYGAVRKSFAANQAYSNAATAYDREVVLLYSEIDPALHTAVKTGNYGSGTAMESAIHYKPRYFLINGTPFSSGKSPFGAASPFAPGNKILLRFLNAGLRDHVPVCDDLKFTIIAQDGNEKSYPEKQYSLFLPAGKTVDALLTPAVAGYYAIYDRRLDLTNHNQSGGGMVAYLAAGSNPQHALNVTKTGTGTGKVETSSAPGGILCGTNCSENYLPNTVVTLTATPATGSRFLGWSGDVFSADGTVAVAIMNAARNVTASFAAAPPMTVISPNGGETFARGAVMPISWQYAGNPGPFVQIQLFKGGVLQTTITSQTSVGTNGAGSFNWTIPPGVPVGANYRVKITSTSNSTFVDRSNANFTIN